MEGYISKAKLDELKTRMERLGVSESDIEEKFVLGSGHGGQKINKTSSCVFLLHKPTGITVKCQATRSREKNRYFARRRLCELIEQQKKKVDDENDYLDYLEKAQSKKRSISIKNRILDDKKSLSKKKKFRSKKINIDD